MSAKNDDAVPDEGAVENEIVWGRVALDDTVKALIVAFCKLLVPDDTKPLLVIDPVAVIVLVVVTVPNDPLRADTALFAVILIALKVCVPVL